MRCRNESVAADTDNPDTPAVDGDETAAQMFSGGTTLGVADHACPLKNLRQFLNTLEDNIC